MANGWTIIIGFIVVVALCAASYVFSPKGDYQTIWRSSLILTIASMYMMWALTILAQLNPLAVPLRNDLRPEKHGDSDNILMMLS